LRFDVFGIVLKIVFTFLFRKIHGDVGVFHQGLLVLSVLGKDADSNAGGDAAFFRHDHHGLDGGGKNFVRHFRHLGEVAEIFDENHEFITAKTADDIDGS